MNIQKWIPTIITVAGLVLAAFLPAIKNLALQHPNIAMVLVAIWSVINHFAPSPVL